MKDSYVDLAQRPVIKKNRLLEALRQPDCQQAMEELKEKVLRRHLPTYLSLRSAASKNTNSLRQRINCLSLLAYYERTRK